MLNSLARSLAHSLTWNIDETLNSQWTPHSSPLMPQSHPTKGPVRLLSPVRFLARNGGWHARRNFTSVLFSWSQQATGYGPRTTWYGCTLMVWSNDSQDSTGTPCDARTGIVRTPQGNLQCFSYPTGPVWVPCGTRKGAVRHPYGHVRELIQPELTKILHGRRIWQYGARTVPARAVHGLFRISKPVRGT